MTYKIHQDKREKKKLKLPWCEKGNHEAAQVRLADGMWMCEKCLKEKDRIK